VFPGMRRYMSMIPSPLYAGITYLASYDQRLVVEFGRNDDYTWEHPTS
jgi:hypothetical protein